jgi:hypothetical protein
MCLYLQHISLWEIHVRITIIRLRMRFLGRMRVVNRKRPALRVNSVSMNISKKIIWNYLGSEVLTAVVMKSTIFCLPPAFTLVSCSAYFFNPEDGGYMFLRNVGWISTDYTLLATCFHAGLLLSLFFQPWRWRLYVPPKRRLNFNGLHSTCHVLSRWSLAQLIFRPWKMKRYVPPKSRLTFNGLRGVLFQKTVLFIWN